MNPFYLSVLLFSFLFGFIFIIVSKIHYSNKYNNSYSIKGMFPYELNFKARFHDNFYGNSSIVLSSVGMISFYIYLLIENHISPLFLWLSISGIISCLCCLGFVFVPLFFLKIHLLVDALCFGTTLIKLTLIFISCLTKNNSDPSIMNNVVMYLSLVSSLIVLILIINPKLSIRFSYQTKINDKGESIKIRPKWIVLAFSEWLLIFFNYISLALLFLHLINK